VVTFDPHPASVVAPERELKCLATLEQRLEGLALLGIEQVRVLRFDETQAAESAESFVERILVEELHAIDVVAGDDTHFGRNRGGDASLLEREGERWGFRVHATPSYGPEARWSSSSVRAALAEGDVTKVAGILGRPFVLRGVVEHGDARGRTIGFPTANLGVAPHQALPSAGIYAGAVRLPTGEWRCGAVSVGTRPHFYDDGHLLVEVHLPGFSGDLYETTLDLAFLARLRGEAKFESLEALLEQISADVEDAQLLFNKFTADDFKLLG